MAEYLIPKSAVVFEEEIKKFKPSLEVEQIEDAVYQEDLTDMTDILREMMQQQTK